MGLHSQLNHNQPYNVLYFRVSTTSQDEEMQMGVTYATANKMKLENILELNDHGVSANTVPLHQRPQLNVLLDLIKEGRVSHLLVFARDRLARDSFEYAEILKVFYAHSVKVIYTMENTPAFQDDFGMELLLSVFSKFEGMQIRNRTQENNKQFPPKLFGYKKDHINGVKQYFIDRSKEQNIVEMFNDCAAIHDIKEFAYFLVKYQKVHQRNAEQLLNILQNPFYSANMIHGSSYVTLPHVEPMISLDLFKDVKQKVDLYKKKIIHAMQKPMFIHPKCGICGHRMKINGRNLINSGYYMCKNNHQKVAVDVEELEKETYEIVNNFIHHLSVNNIQTLTENGLRKIIKQFQNTIEKQRKQITDAYVKVSLSYSPNDTGVSVKLAFEEIRELEYRYKENTIKMSQIQVCLNQVKQLSELMIKSLKEFLDQMDIVQLIHLLVDSIDVTDEQLKFKLYFGELLKESQYA